MKAVPVGEYLICDPEVVHGRLTFRGTRVPVSQEFAYLAKGLSVDEVPRHWPQVRPEAVAEALELAVAALERVSRGE